jgi:HK97 family phage major capsid protein
MKFTEVKDGEDLKKYLAEQEGTVGAFLVENEKLKGEVALLHAKIKEDAARVDKSYGELVTIIKGKWKETEPEKVRCAGIARIVKIMLDARNGVPGAGKELENLGCIRNMQTGSEEEWKEIGWEMKSANVGSAPLRGDAVTGSYLIPADYVNEVMRVALTKSAMMSKIRTWPMKARTVYFPAESTMLSWYWVTNENTAKTRATYTFTQITLSAKTCASWIPITEELDEDSLVPLGTYFRDVFAEAWGKEYDEQALVSNADPHTGAMRASGVNAVYLGAGCTSFTDVGTDDLSALISALTTQAKREGAVFVAHPTVWDYIFNQRTADGEYIWHRQGFEGRPPRVLGYGYVECDAMPDIDASAKNTPFILFGNLSRILFGDRTGFEFRIFDQTIDTMEYDRIFLRARLRAAFVCAVPAAFSVLYTANA